MIRRILLTLLIVMVSYGVSYAIFDKYTIDREQLPASAIEMLDEHFPKQKISMIKIDKHLLKKTDYDVKLLNGTKIEFSNAGKWTSVDCGKKAVPEGLVHKKILSYVSDNYEGTKIVRVAKSLSGYEIGLCNGKTLNFNLLYQFKGEAQSDEI
ncbi:MAG: PepSY-like domain-containing protein [Muribaculaceae bacterium]|nr:PepSY-like domain-containing protein [Muribaculaceae bacterium]